MILVAQVIRTNSYDVSVLFSEGILLIKNDSLLTLVILISSFIISFHFICRRLTSCLLKLISYSPEMSECLCRPLNPCLHKLTTDLYSFFVFVLNYVHTWLITWTIRPLQESTFIHAFNYMLQDRPFWIIQNKYIFLHHAPHAAG